MTAARTYFDQLNDEDTDMAILSPAPMQAALPDTFWMLLAEPHALTRDSHGNHRLVSGAPQSIFVTEEKAREVAARLAHDLDRRIYLLKCTASCTPPAPAVPPVEWHEAVIRIEPTERDEPLVEVDTDVSNPPIEQRTVLERDPIPKPEGGVAVGHLVKFIGVNTPESIVRIREGFAFSADHRIELDRLDWDETEGRWDEENPF